MMRLLPAPRRLRRSRSPPARPGRTMSRHSAARAASGPFLSRERRRSRDAQPAGPTGGGSTTIRCSTGWSPTRSPPTPTSASPSPASTARGRRCARRGSDRLPQTGRRRERAPMAAAAESQRRPGAEREDWQRRCRASTSPTRSICSAASRREIEAARGDVGAAAADADAVRVAVVAETDARLCRRRLGRRADQTVARAYRRPARPFAAADPAARSRPASPTGSTSSRIATLRDQRRGRDPGARRRAPGRACSGSRR